MNYSRPNSDNTEVLFKTARLASLLDDMNKVGVMFNTVLYKPNDYQQDIEIEDITNLDTIDFELLKSF